MTVRKLSFEGLLLVAVASIVLLATADGKATAGSAVAAFHGSRGEGHCAPVGGTVMTNFINSSTTLGTATGDLQGAVSASLLGAPQPGPGGSVVFHVQHHWVTEGGDTLTIDPAVATTHPVSQTLFAGVTYSLHI